MSTSTSPENAPRTHAAGGDPHLDDVWAEIAARVDEHAYMDGVERARARIDATGEVFTPTALVITLLRQADPSSYGPGKAVLDPACGDGQFLSAVKWAKVLIHHMTEADACADLYGVDIMRDNVELTRARLGGGTIVMGDALNPHTVLPGQRAGERRTLIALLGR